MMLMNQHDHDQNRQEIGPEQPDERAARQTPEDDAPSKKSADDWPDPLPFPSNEFAPASFDAELLPPAFRKWGVDVSKRMQVPLDYIAVSMMVMAGSAIGRRLCIRPKQYDDWSVVANLWGVIIGSPGYKKSPALAEATSPIRKLEREAAKQNEKALKEYEAEQKWKGAKGGEKNARLEEAGSVEEAEKIISEYETDRPAMKRFMTSDPTVEKAIEIARDNPKGFLLLRDELEGWFASLSKSYNEDARQFYLEAWSGTGSFTQDRIGRGTVQAESVCISILGSIQPGVLHTRMRGSLDDGLIQRFQLTTYPEVSEYQNVDQQPDWEAKKKTHEIIRNMVEGVSQDVRTPTSPGDDGPPYLRFTPEAQSRFTAWLTELENRLRSQDEPPAFNSHLSKYRSLLPSLALIYHLATDEKGAVGVTAFEAAKEWTEYLESHARRMYAPILKPEIDSAHNLAEHIRGGEIRDGFTIRDVYRKGWSGLAKKANVEPAVRRLEKLKWIEGRKDDTGGRPTTRYYFNQKILS